MRACACVWVWVCVSVRPSIPTPPISIRHHRFFLTFLCSTSVTLFSNGKKTWLSLFTRHLLFTQSYNIHEIVLELLLMSLRPTKQLTNWSSDLEASLPAASPSFQLTGPPSTGRCVCGAGPLLSGGSVPKEKLCLQQRWAESWTPPWPGSPLQVLCGLRRKASCTHLKAAWRSHRQSEPFSQQEFS